MKDALWNRFPPYHVRRERLSEACDGHQVVVVEAAGGYGKSVFAAELVEHRHCVGIDVPLEHAGVTAPLLAARLHDAVARSGFTVAAAAAEGKQDPLAVVDALLDRLAEEPCAFVVDDAHNLARDAGELLEYLAAHVRPSQGLVVLARQLPVGAGRLRRAEYLQLTAADLALRAEETAAICRLGFGLDVDDRAAKALGAATGGWTAATVLAAARAVRTGEPVEAVVDAGGGPDHPAGALGAILDDGITALGRDSGAVLAQIARLPLLDAALVGAVAGDDGFFERALRAGIPFAVARGDWWELAGPVRDHLARLAPPQTEAMRVAADVYRSRGELGAAVELLLATDDASAAAAVLAAVPPEAEDDLDTLELGAYFDRLGREAIDANPGVLLLVARRFGHSGRYAQCCELLDRARDIAGRTGDRILDRAAAAELVKVRFLAEQRYAEAIEAARDLVAEAGPSEDLTRARASEFLGYALAHEPPSSEADREACAVQAEECAARAWDLYRKLGMRSAAAFIAVDRSSLIDFPHGRAEAALERIEEALLLVRQLPRARGFLLLWRASFAAELGRDDLFRSTIGEILSLAADMAEGQRAFLLGQADRRIAMVASYRGDVEATIEHLRKVEPNARVWWALDSAEFLAEAADALGRVGQQALAQEHLARARDDPKDARHLVDLAEAVLEARHGDPFAAEERLLGLGEGRVDQRERWRVVLMRAYAAFRRGDGAAAAALGAQAFEEAARLGQPQAPLIREREVTESLLGLAAETGQPAAVALESSSLPLAVAVLGRFEVTEGGRTVELGSGQGAQLLKLVAVSGGAVHVERAIEGVWPEVSPDAGRNRLRTVLNRLRDTTGDIVRREGDLLALAPDVRLDLAQFSREAREALALRGDPGAAVAVARSAIARYRGDVLPHDVYEEWSVEARDEARRTMLDLLDLCAAAAAERGDLDETRRLVERTIELAPYDDGRYLSVATILRDQGRRGAASSVLQRARSTLARLGIDPPPELLELEQSPV
ncbi:MAG TPA: BTAD domain-containing putative transcriptional regulator [Gaiellaceae bacterium]|jgi:DNA-binding SARP family transcriptional activator